MPEGFRIATAFVQVSPDTEGFKEELKSKLDEAIAGLDAKAKVKLDTSELGADADKAKAQVDEVGAKTARPKVSLNDAEAAAKLREIRARLDALSADDPSPKVRADISDAQAKAASIEARIDRLNSIIARPQVTPQMADAQARIDALQEKLDGLSREEATPKVTADIAAAQAEIDALKAKLEELKSKDTQVRVKAGADLMQAQAQLDRLLIKLDELGEKTARPKLGLDDSEFKAKLDKDKADLASAGEGGMLGGHGLMAGLTAGVTGLLPGLGGAATGLGLLGATGALAFGGISKALGDAHQASMNVGITQQQMAATEFSNSVQIQQAQQAVAEAHQQAAQDAVTSAHSIESAQMNLAATERNTAESQIQALHSVEQAQQGLEQANYGLSEAQYNLNQAWVQAREQIIQLNDQLADSKLNVQSAQLAIQQAIYQQKLVDQNAYSTQLDREQAALAVVRAQQQLKDASDQEANSQYAANLANKQGVEHSQTVIQAKQGVIQATYAQKNAQFAYADAQRQLTLTELNNAQQVKSAQMQVAAAEEQAAYQRMRDAQQVAIAERNVSNTIKEQQLQMAATMSTSNQAANQFAKDMSRMTPAAQALVRQILGMRDGFRGLEAAAQNAVAPGLTVFLQGLQHLMPTIQAGVTRMGGAISAAFGEIGKAMATPQGAHVLDGLINNGIRFAQIVLPAFGGFAGALAKVGAQKGAVDGIANLLGGLGHALTNVVNALSPFVGSLSSVFGTLGKALEPIGTLLGTVVGSLARALAPALQALLPGFNALVGALGQGLSIALQALAPLLKPVAEAISAIASAAAPLLPVFGQLIAQLAQALTPVLQAVVPVIKQLAQLLVKDLQDGLFQIIKAIMPLLPVVGKLIISLMPLISLVLKIAGVIIDLAAKLIGPLVSAIVWVIKWIVDLAAHWQVAFKAIEIAALWLWHNVLDPMWQGIAAGSVWLYNNAILPLWHGIQTAFGWIEQAAMWMWHNVFDPLWHGIEAGARGFVDAFQAVWHGLEDVFKTPVNFLIDPVYDKGIAGLWNKVVNAIGMKSLEMPTIAKLAVGGVIPGYAPGQDTVPAMLSPGEGVLVPEAVQALGPDTVHSLNATFGGGRVSGGGHFAGGGLVKDIWHGITSAYHKAVDIGKITAALATGNGTAFTNALNDLVKTDALGDYAKLMIGVPKALISNAVKQVISMFTSSSGAGGGGGGGGAGVQRWSNVVLQALKLVGQPAGLLGITLQRMDQESGGNPTIVNRWDSNWLAGTPSVGLMQVIGPTFRSFAGPFAGTGPFEYGVSVDPLANIYASMEYALSTYGSLASAYGRAGGYDSGGWLMPGDMPINGLKKPEAVLTPDQSEAFIVNAEYIKAQRAGGAAADRPITVEQHFHGTQWPNAEQKAAMQRDLALALGGAS